MLSSLEHHPWRWTAALLAPLLLFPQIDISLSALFFEPGRNIFVLRSHPFGEFVRKILPAGLFALAALVGVLGVVARFRPPVLAVTARRAVYLLGCLALGPGLIVNTVLKDYWGRARPSTIDVFGGPNQYTFPLIPSDQCPDNCSFPSGHAALGFWMVSFALLAPPEWRRRALWAGIAFGIFMGLVRIAQGGHFLSDVVFSGIIVCAVSQMLHRAIIVRSSMTNVKNIDEAADESS